MKKLRKILTTAITTAALFGFIKSTEAQFFGTMNRGIRIGFRPGTECQSQYGNHPPYGHHINTRCYINNVPVFNYHIRPQDYVRTAVRLAPSAMTAIGHYQQVNRMGYHINQGQYYQQRINAINRQGLRQYNKGAYGTIAPNYYPQLNNHRIRDYMYEQQTRFIP